MRTSLLIAVILLQAPLIQANDIVPSAGEIRQSVERSLPYLEREGNAWIKKRNCASCHVVTFMLWSHNEALSRGIKVDAKKLEEWTIWTLNHSLGQRSWFKLSEPSLKQLQAEGLAEVTAAKLKPVVDKSFISEKAFLDEIGKVLSAEESASCQAKLVKRAGQPKKGGQNDGGGLDTLSQLLVGRAGGKIAKMNEFLDAGPAVMVKWQEADGSWKAAGQLPNQKRPAEESNVATTGWAILGLMSLDQPQPAIAKSIDSGLAYFSKTKPGKTIETWLVHWLVERKMGKRPQEDGLLKEILARQNADGGWGWVAGGPSDAFATGQTLYALSLVGPNGNDTPIHRAQKYLLDTQNKEGFWVVPPQAISSSTAAGRLQRLVPIYDYWGTAWAAIGLSRSLRNDN